MTGKKRVPPLLLPVLVPVLVVVLVLVLGVPQSATNRYYLRVTAAKFPSGPRTAKPPFKLL